MGFSFDVIEDRAGLFIFEVSGPGAAARFEHEPGGHRFQRVPPTEKRGRMQTSTITVAVLTLPKSGVNAILEADCEWQATRGSGKGGQARNKTSNCVLMTHKPSGLSVRVENGRSQSQNRQTALRLLAARLAARAEEAASASSSATRRAQVGSGMRGDKVRTIRTQDDRVIDHKTGKVTTFTRYSKGFVDDLYV